MELVDLTAAPEAIPLLAEWHVREWHHLYPQWSVDAAIAELEAMLAPQGLPRTIVAFAGAGRAPHDLVGSVSVIEDDELPGFGHLRPWLASLYVAPPARGRGLGARLVAAAVECADELGEEQLFLFTAGQEQFYERLGWRSVARSTMNGEAAIVMTIRCSGEADPGRLGA
jgi:GNAT superfamily N-acetyltransferase